MSTLTTVEAARLVGVDPITIRTWMWRHGLQPVRPGAKPLRFREGDVVECHAERMTEGRHAQLDETWRRVCAEADDLQR